MKGISIENLNLYIRKAHILKDIQAFFPSNMITGIIGINGSGKSMLLKSICGFLQPNSGRIVIDGIDYYAKRRFPVSLGFIIESPAFIENMSGFANLEHLAAIQSKISDYEIAEAIINVGLDPNDNRPVRKYSLGMKQRLGIAQAFMEKPDILILDEPMNGLDKDAVQKMRLLIREYKTKDRTIVLTSHNSEDIEQLCDHVYEMSSGELHPIR